MQQLSAKHFRRYHGVIKMFVSDQICISDMNGLSKPDNFRVSQTLEKSNLSQQKALLYR